MFGVDEETMEHAVAAQLVARGLSFGVAESLTGGLIASAWSMSGCVGRFRGGVVAYQSQVKFDVLGVPEGPVVSEAAAIAMAQGVRRVTRADVGLGITGVAGPDDQEGVAPGTIFVGLRSPMGRWTREKCICPEIVTACVNTGRSPHSTCCVGPSSPLGRETGPLTGVALLGSSFTGGGRHDGRRCFLSDALPREISTGGPQPGHT